MVGKCIVCLLLVLTLSKGMIVPPQPSIISIDFVVSGCSIKSKMAGFISQNLNEGAGGKYIYAVATKSFQDKDAISNIDVVSGSTPCPSGFTRIWQNLNEGAYGKSLYLCIERKWTSGKYRLLDIAFEAYSSPLKLKNYATLKKDWIFWKQDFNEGVGGKYIYMFFRKSLF